MASMTEMDYDFEWDNSKAGSNLKKHGVTFEQAATVFLDVLAVTVFDVTHSQYEERWFTLRQPRDGALLAVVHTYQVTSAHSIHIRIISARLATKQERRFYANNPQR